MPQYMNYELTNWRALVWRIARKSKLYEDMLAMSIYSYIFKSVIFENVKIKIFSKVSDWWSQKSFSRSFENDTFESVILESVKIYSVRVDRLSRCHPANHKKQNSRKAHKGQVTWDSFSCFVLLGYAECSRI